MWVGEKFQSNPEIAGSPRNSFRASLILVYGGRALNSRGGVKAYQRISNSECHVDDEWGVRLYEISWIVERERAQTTG